MYFQGADGDANNCTLVSIANLTGTDYGTVKTAALKSGAYVANEYTRSDLVPALLSDLHINSATKYSQRGIEKLSGIVHFSGSQRLGHTVAMIQGKILDTNGTWYHLKGYQETKGFRIRSVNVIADPDIDYSIIPEGVKKHFTIPRPVACKQCLSDSHLESDCPLTPVWKG